MLLYLESNEYTKPNSKNYFKNIQILADLRTRKTGKLTIKIKIKICLIVAIFMISNQKSYSLLLSKYILHIIISVNQCLCIYRKRTHTLCFRIVFCIAEAKLFLFIGPEWFFLLFIYLSRCVLLLLLLLFSWPHNLAPKHTHTHTRCCIPIIKSLLSELLFTISTTSLCLTSNN